MERQKRTVRHHPVHGVHISSQKPTIVFLTVCTRNRSPWLATDEHHARLRSVWLQATAWRTGRYVLMPDHLHLLAVPGEPQTARQLGSLLEVAVQQADS